MGSLSVALEQSGPQRATAALVVGFRPARALNVTRPTAGCSAAFPRPRAGASTSTAPRRPARSCTRCGPRRWTSWTARSCRPSTTAPSTPPRCGSACSARRGAPAAEILGLFDPLLAALGWLAGPADADGDGFLEYFDASGHGLANQGWTDSGDSVRFADGAIAEGPIALAEVQGYAYQAARTASELLGALGRTAEERASAGVWAAYADAMAARFRQRFWVRDADGPYPALALDARKVPVTGVASNMGHLLGTGMLTAEEERLVVARIMGPALFTGYGVRTMSSDNAAYWPARYHVGSVWTHDTALIIEGMLEHGFDREARLLAGGLLRASEGFGGQLPELFGGQPADELFPPAPYPAACPPRRGRRRPRSQSRVHWAPCPAARPAGEPGPSGRSGSAAAPRWWPAPRPRPRGRRPAPAPGGWSARRGRRSPWPRPGPAAPGS